MANEQQDQATVRSTNGDWLNAFYDDVDHMRMDAFLGHFTDDGVVEFANNPAAQGKDEIRGAIGGLWAAIDGLSHDIHERYDAPSRSIIEATCTYKRKDGRLVPIAIASSLARRDGKISKLKIYMDIAPLFAAEPADAVTA